MLHEFQMDCVIQTCFLFGSGWLSDGHRLGRPGFLGTTVYLQAWDGSGGSSPVMCSLISKPFFPRGQVWCSVTETGFGYIPALPLSNCVSLSQILTLSEFLALIYKWGGYCIYLTEL